MKTTGLFLFLLIWVTPGGYIVFNATGSSLMAKIWLWGFPAVVISLGVSVIICHLKEGNKIRSKRSSKLAKERSCLLSKGFMRPATVREYADWLQGHLERGGGITHGYNYPMPRGIVFVARRSFSIPAGMCGNKSFSVIVPEGIKVDRIGHDHCNILGTRVDNTEGICIAHYSNLEEYGISSPSSGIFVAID